MRCLIIGAGAVGRGLIAPLLLRAGYAITLIDSSRSLVEPLKERLYYPALLKRGGEIGLHGPCRSAVIIPSLDEIDAVFVSVRVENFQSAGQALGSRLRERTSKKPLPIIVCENTPNAAEKFSAIAGTPDHVFYRSAIAECIIPEMPQEIRAIDPLLTYIDPKGHLIIDSQGLDEEADWQDVISSVDGMVFSKSLSFLWDLKWYCHCALHALVGLLGRQVGHVYVHEVMQDWEIRNTLRILMGAVALNLDKKHGDHLGDSGCFREIQERIDREFEQLADSARPDTCERVTRDLRRKLQKGERLMDMLELVGKNEILEETIEYAKTIS